MRDPGHFYWSTLYILPSSNKTTLPALPSLPHYLLSACIPFQVCGIENEFKGVKLFLLSFCRQSSTGSTQLRNVKLYHRIVILRIQCAIKFNCCLLGMDELPTTYDQHTNESAPPKPHPYSPANYQLRLAAVKLVSVKNRIAFRCIHRARHS